MLVITGKGAAADTTRPFYESDERGVLRQAVPHWLAAPDLAPVVLSYSEAPRRLGGEGALYVRLRKPRLPPPERGRAGVGVRMQGRQACQRGEPPTK